MTRLTRAQRDESLAYWIKLRDDLADCLQAQGADSDNTACNMLRADIESANDIIDVLRRARCVS